MSSKKVQAAIGGPSGAETALSAELSYRATANTVQASCIIRQTPIRVSCSRLPSAAHDGTLSPSAHHSSPHYRCRLLLRRAHRRCAATKNALRGFIDRSVGYAVGSLALVADSFHMLKYALYPRSSVRSNLLLSDVLSLVVALYAIKVGYVVIVVLLARSFHSPSVVLRQRERLAVFIRVASC